MDTEAASLFKFKSQRKLSVFYDVVFSELFFIHCAARTKMWNSLVGAVAALTLPIVVKGYELSSNAAYRVDSKYSELKAGIF